jgi:hydrogenase maturation protein HypF
VAFGETSARAAPRIGIRVTGAVQGVGFRPFVHRTASALGLSGFVRNEGDCVWIEAEGVAVDAFVHALTREAPPLARIEAVDTVSLTPLGGADFQIAQSAATGAGRARIPPDAGICASCVAEMFDRGNLRHLYPFIACCDCGPRLTMTRHLPYDRAATAMAEFPLCQACDEDYTDPASRRFHAEPTCCAACGPKLSHSPSVITARLMKGDLVAVQGVGGFHLMADARNADAISRLRMRKERGAKPFALMALNVASIQRIAILDGIEKSALESPARPIVLLETKATFDSHAIAPHLDTIGLMLPSTPLHWLIFWEVLGRPQGDVWRSDPCDLLFVCTSGNRGGEPLATNRQEAEAALDGIADMIVSHDREIVVRADDPVMRVMNGAPAYLRRGRGVTPEPIKLSRAVAPTLAFGAHLKASACVTRGSEAYLAQHVGDLDDVETLRFYRETIHRMCALLDVRPERVACDAHPDFASTRIAQEWAHDLGAPLIEVQHHHAHVAACAAENNIDAPVLGLALDGYGYGEEGEAWGGELLHVDGATMQRIGHLSALPLSGGERAAREPWRMAAAVLAKLGRAAEIAPRFQHERAAQGVGDMLRGARCSETTSCGRWFDAAAGLLAAPRQTYEGEAAMCLEALARQYKGVAHVVSAPMQSGVLDLLPVMAALLDCTPEEGAAIFHASLIDGLARLAAYGAQETGLKHVALTGGCFANKILSEGVALRLRKAGLVPLLHRACPPGDGGLSLGQAWVAAHREGF